MLERVRDEVVRLKEQADVALHTQNIDEALSAFDYGKASAGQGARVRAASSLRGGDGRDIKRRVWPEAFGQGHRVVHFDEASGALHEREGHAWCYT